MKYPWDTFVHILRRVLVAKILRGKKYKMVSISFTYQVACGTCGGTKKRQKKRKMTRK